MFVQNFTHTNYIAVNEKEIQVKIINNLGDDYLAAIRLRSTCKDFKKLVDEAFREMKVWQERCCQVHLLSNQIIFWEAKVQQLKNPKQAESLPNSLSLLNWRDSLIPDLPNSRLNRKINELSQLKNQKKRLCNMLKGMHSLIHSDIYLIKLLGDYKQIMQLPELDSNNILPGKLLKPIMKRFDENGHLSFLISDQGASIFELKIEKWEMNKICRVECEGVSGIYQFNKMLDFNDYSICLPPIIKIVVLAEEVQPFWVIKQYCGRIEPISTEPFSFGLRCNDKHYRYLEKSIERSTTSHGDFTTYERYL